MRTLALASAIGAAAYFGGGTTARADLVGHWLSGAPNLSETSGFRVAGTHDGVAVGDNAGALSFSSDVPAGCTGETLDLTSGNVGVSINNSATGDSGYVDTYDDLIRSEFTVAFWAKGFPGEWGPWVSKRGEDGTGWQLRRMGNDPISGFTLRGVDNDDGWGSPINVSDNQPIWHHYAGVWNQTTGTRTLYVDGVFSHVVNNNTAQVMTQATGKHLGLGARAQGGNGYESYFSGKLFDVRIYNTPLTQNQVLELLPPTTPSGLAATPGNAKVGLLWTPKPGATGYTVSTTNTATGIEQTDTTPDAFFSKAGLINGTLYTFKILSTNSMGSSAYTSEVSTIPVLGSAKDILTLNITGQGPATFVGTNIIKDVPVGTDVTSLTATYSISPFATPDAANPS
ncbi:MAG: LamG domain-containing protein, partial [Verrucomicrobiota bacterium]